MSMVKPLIFLALCLTACAAPNTAQDTAADRDRDLAVQCDTARMTLSAKSPPYGEYYDTPEPFPGQTDEEFAARQNMQRVMNDELRALRLAVARCDENDR